MSQLGSVRATVVVDMDRFEAFEVFTEEIGDWYRRGAASLGNPKQEDGLQLEPHLGGRVLRVGGPDSGDVVEVGRITAWEPGRLFVFVDHRQTEVEVRFDPIAGGTRVVLEHRGLDRLPPDVAAALGQYGWRRLVFWFEAHLKEKTT